MFGVWGSFQKKPKSPFSTAGEFDIIEKIITGKNPSPVAPEGNMIRS
jgi:hypothetical protein